MDRIEKMMASTLTRWMPQVPHRNVLPNKTSEAQTMKKKKSLRDK